MLMPRKENDIAELDGKMVARGDVRMHLKAKGCASRRVCGTCVCVPST